jgi:hypothetical protein
MTEAIIWIGALLLVAGLLFALINEGRRRAAMTEEEYQEQARSQPSLLGSTGLALDEVLRPKVKTAMEYQQDKQRGQVPGGEQKGAAGPENES